MLDSCALQGTNLIEASAGTGKTHAIVSLFLRLVLERELPVSQILVVTFTEAATQELRHRIRIRLSEKLTRMQGADSAPTDRARTLLRTALSEFDRAAISTIHGFCQRVLADNSFESGSLFETGLTADQSDLLESAIADFWRLHLADAGTLFLRYAGARKFDLAYLRRLMGLRSHDPGFQVVPCGKKAKLDALERDLQKTYERIRSAWQQKRSEIVDVLLGDQALNRNVYRPARMARLSAVMDDYLSVDEVRFVFTDFDKFTASTIREATRRGARSPRHAFFDLCEQFMLSEAEVTRGFDAHLAYLTGVFYAFVDKQLTEKKRAANLRYFDDLLVDLYQALQSENAAELVQSVRRQYRAALIDEFQDTDPLQYEILRKIFDADDDNTTGILYIVGDPKQAIYRFRGADVFAYMGAAARAPVRYSLNINWRAGATLVHAINALFLHHGAAFVFQQIQYRKVFVAQRGTQPPESPRSESPRSESPQSEGPLSDWQTSPADNLALQIWFLGEQLADNKNGTINKRTAERLLSEAMAAEISRLIDKHLPDTNEPVTPGDIAVLVRKNYQADIMRRELEKLAIPSVLYSAESVFATTEAGELYTVILAVAEPGDEALVRAALGTDALGASGVELYRLAQCEQKWEETLRRFQQYHQVWSTYGFLRMFRSLLESQTVHERLLSYVDGERRITNILHCGELLQKAEAELGLGMRGLLRWFGERIFRPADAQEHQLRLETDQRAVKLVTIHRSKGLEYPVVFCPYLWDGSKVGKKDFTFHDPGRDNHVTLDVGSENIVNHRYAEREELAENMRLLYVAVTRAKTRCYLAWGKINKSQTSALAYLLHGNCLAAEEDDLLRQLDCRLSAMSSQEMLAETKVLERESCGAIQVSELPRISGKRYTRHDSHPERLFSRSFSGKIHRDWRIASYSALISRTEFIDDLPDHDRMASSGDRTAASERTQDIFNFPRGTAAGHCIHAIFENLDFCLTDQRSSQEVIEESLQRHGFDTVWTGIIAHMVEKVVHTPLEEVGAGFCLQRLSREERLNEVEFCFPLDLITPETLSCVYRENADGGLPTVGLPTVGQSMHAQRPGSLPDVLGRLGFAPVRGFMRGFIDMVFCVDDRYYIVDWKSNHLGNTHEDYSPTRLAAEMGSRYYFLQYHLYSLALDGYLRSRVRDYCYRTHFGGVYYIFVRGVDHTRSGIYFDRPSEHLIESLRDCLICRPGR